MAVRKRSWKKPNGETSEAWVVDYKSSGKRHIKTFPTRKEAVAFRDTTGVEVRGVATLPIAFPLPLRMQPQYGSRLASLGVVTVPPQNIRRCVRIALVSGTISSPPSAR
jgi:hypothetical protein